MERQAGLKERELDDKTLSLLVSKIKEACISGEVMLMIVSRIADVKNKGFGEVTEFVRNGYIYRVRISSDDYFYEEDIPTCEK